MDNTDKYRNLPSLTEHVKRKKDKDIPSLERAADEWIDLSMKNGLPYEVEWLGVPVIQTPQDMILMQELIFRTQPDVVVDLGIGHGGSCIFYSSILELLGKGKVIGVDVDIREHNRKVLEAHPLYHRIELIQGSSISLETVAEVEKRIPSESKVVVCLDSNHTKNHVLNELKLYEKFVDVGSYMVVFDLFTPGIAKKGYFGEIYRNNGPREALDEFLNENHDFEIDKEYNKLFISYCIDGFLKRVNHSSKSL
ncbi:MAG: CmcI family methyltransferase [archaeon]|nr:CmcI family methyltransferase [archaeon]